MARCMKFVLAVMALAALAACGGDFEWFPEKNVTPRPPADDPGPQMGGARQKQLTLSQTVSTFAGSSQGFLNGAALTAMFNGPVSVTTDGTNLYVADRGNYVIRKIVISTGEVSTLAGSGSRGIVNGIGASAQFYDPSCITTDGVNLYVGDFSAIRKIALATGDVSTLAGSPFTQGWLDGNPLSALFKFPSGVTTDGANVYVADSGNFVIRRVTIATGTVTTIAGGVGVSGTANGFGTGARFGVLGQITTDGGSLYVADSGNNAIRRIVMSNNSVTTIAAGFSNPTGITTDGKSLYASDTSNSIIRQIDITTAAVTTLAGTQGVPGFADDTGTAAKFNGPAGITTDGKSLFVTDAGNHKIRKIN